MTPGEQIRWSSVRSLLRDAVAEAILRADDEGGNAWDFADAALDALGVRETCGICANPEDNDAHAGLFYPRHKYRPLWFVPTPVPASGAA